MWGGSLFSMFISNNLKIGHFVPGASRHHVVGFSWSLFVTTAS